MWIWVPTLLPFLGVKATYGPPSEQIYWAPQAHSFLFLNSQKRHSYPFSLLLLLFFRVYHPVYTGWVELENILSPAWNFKLVGLVTRTTWNRVHNSTFYFPVGLVWLLDWSGWPNQKKCQFVNRLEFLVFKNSTEFKSKRILIHDLSLIVLIS